MARLYNLARMTTSTTGTGTLTLGSAVSGFLSFSGAGISDGETVTYAIEDGTTSEIGRGVYTASGTTLTRNVLKSTNSNSAINLSGSAQVFITPAAEDLLSIAAPGGRLTLTTATPVLTGTVSGATTVYYTPHVHRFVPLYDGTSFTMTDLGGELSQATTDSTKSPAACTTSSNYDVFVWDDSGTKRATRGPAWSSGTSRGTGAGTTELDRIHGIYTNKVAITNGPAANRGTYVGTIRTNGSSQVDWIYGTIATDGGMATHNVFNAYNRVLFGGFVGLANDSWTYASGTIRAANASSTFRVNVLAGLNEEPITVEYAALAQVVGGVAAIALVGLDSTTTFVGSTFDGYNAGGSAININGFAKYVGLVGLGSHFLSGNESASGGTVTFYGDVGSPSLLQYGLHYLWRC